MAQCFPLLSLLLFFSLTRCVLTSVSERPFWWPRRGMPEVKCPDHKVGLTWFNGTVNPCPGLKQLVCGTNLVTYENQCILCVEYLKSKGKIRFYHNGSC